MRTAVSIMVMGLALASAITTPAFAREDDAATLRRIKQIDWPRYYREQDVDGLAALLAREFQSTDAAGTVTTRQDELDYVRAHRPSYDRFDFAIERLDVFENGSAIVSGQGTIRGRDAEGAYVTTYRSTNVLIRREGRWQAVASHVSGVQRTAAEAGSTRP